MFNKTLFFCVIVYFVYQIILVFREKSISKKLTDLAVGVTILLISFTDWPLYLNIHLAFSILTFLFASGMFFECFKEKNGFYFLTAIILLILSGLQFMEYLGYSAS